MTGRAAASGAPGPCGQGGPVTLPDWWEPLLTRVRTATTRDFTSLPTPMDGRASAVLILLGEADHTGTDVLLLQKAASLRNHAGQAAFPGGGAEPGDLDAADTALREAAEEVGLDRRSVQVVATLPTLWLPVSNYLVSPVLAWWREPHEVRPLDRVEVARVARLPVAELVDPANRLKVRHPSGYVSGAFRVRGMLVWGFTAGILSGLLDMAGWSRPWTTDRVEELPLAGDQPLVDDDADARSADPGGPPVP